MLGRLNVSFMGVKICDIAFVDAFKWYTSHLKCFRNTGGKYDCRFGEL